jgi:hypothetical protein
VTESDADEFDNAIVSPFHSAAARKLAADEGRGTGDCISRSEVMIGEGNESEERQHLLKLSTGQGKLTASVDMDAKTNGWVGG